MELFDIIIFLVILIGTFTLTYFMIKKYQGDNPFFL